MEIVGRYQTLQGLDQQGEAFEGKQEKDGVADRLEDCQADEEPGNVSSHNQQDQHHKAVVGLPERCDLRPMRGMSGRIRR